ncbi:MAG: hypothetical protein JW776_05660 [Candidatus Lokiarchaeota archaeon]|nr:hypothetical protein [Candidatus Lokiarchaeota archaeon]
MKKGKLLLASMGIIGLFLLVPFVQAASSQVWFNDTTEIIYRYTEELLDESMQVADLNSSYRKLNFTEVVPGTDHINITGKLYTASTADVSSYGYNDPTIWTLESMSIDGDIEDNDLMTKFKSFFNELNTDLTEIQTLSAENQTMVLMIMNILLDPSVLAIVFVYILIKAFGGYFVLDTNSTTINSISARKINYDLDIQYGNETDGVWENITLHSTSELTYGKTSNMLLKSVCTSRIDASEGNSSGVVTETVRARYTHEVVYPDELVNDYPAVIPGYPLWILVGAMVLGIIPLYLIIKRKKK